MRKLVTLETVVEVRPIPDADAIEAVVIRGWVVVAKRGEFQVGDCCVYFRLTLRCRCPMSGLPFSALVCQGPICCPRWWQCESPRVRLFLRGGVGV